MTREAAIKRITRRRGRVAAIDSVRAALARLGPVRAPTVHRVRV